MVDSIIESTGCYQPIELLFKFDLLNYGQYRQWREGHIHYLSPFLENNTQLIMQLLEQATDYVKKLKMQAETIHYQQWQKNQTIHLFPVPKKHILKPYLETQYIRDDHDQMDLFFDNQSLLLTKQLLQALICRDVKTAYTIHQQLQQSDSLNEMLAPSQILLNNLVHALEELNISDLAEHNKYLYETLHPLARKILVGQEQDYMSFFWYRLAQQIDDSLYQENGINTLHSSECLMQIPDWQAVTLTIENIPKLEEQYPKLQLRLIQSYYYSQNDQQYFQSVCHFLWDHKQTELSNIETIINISKQLKNIWKDFLDQLHEYDNLQQWDFSQFPSWLLIFNPGILKLVQANETTPQSFIIIQQLLNSELTHKQPNINLREQLQKLDAQFFQFYLDEHGLNES